MDRINKKLRNEDLVLLKMEEISDWNTFLHSVRVGFITEEVLDAMTNEDKNLYTETERSHIIRGAFLHDCGKTLNGLNLQQLPRKLNNLEFIIIANHVIIGSMFVENFPTIIKDIVKYHHSIPVEQDKYIQFPSDRDVPKYLELVALVDRFDALISDRPYHKGMNPEIVLKILKENDFWGFSTLEENYEIILKKLESKIEDLDKPTEVFLYE